MESVNVSGAVRPRVQSAAALPWQLSALLFGSTSIVVGLLWDLSWHLTIGRDTLWSPPHVAIYLGAVLAGIACGAMAIRTTFAGTEAERAVAVRFWGFRAPIGAWVATWGALALLVSAPFDNWWHDAYGLDIDRFTPPHALLLVGMITIQIGTMILAVSAQNRATGSELRSLGLAHLYAAGIVMVMLIPVHIMEPQRRHTALWYEMMAVYLPLFLVAAARASRLRWAATISAAFYMLIPAAMVWILPLFEGRPRLGPVITEVDRMAAPLFPLLLVPPALAIDFLLQRRKDKNAGWLGAVTIGTGFFLVFFLVHWYTAGFFLSPGARNWFFGADRFVSYAAPRPGEAYFKFWGAEEDPMTVAAFVISLICAIASTRVGLWWGQWMAKVRR